MLDPESKNLNIELVRKGFDQFKELSQIYDKMGEAVQRHRLEIIKFIDLVQTFGVVDDSILKRLDDSVELLLKTIDAFLRIPKDQESGLGETLVPRILLLGGHNKLDVKVFKSGPFIRDVTVLAGYRLPFPQGISIRITFEPPTITFEYRRSNIDDAINIFVLTKSNNIIDPISGIDSQPIFIFPDVFKTKMLEELTKLAAILGIFNFENERINDFACDYKEYAHSLGAI